MTFPIDIHIGSIIVPSHLILDVIAFYAATRYYLHKKSNHPGMVSGEDRWTLIIGAAVGALIGSRLLASLEDIPYTLAHFSLMAIYAQETIVGGIIGGILGVEIAKKLKSIKISTGDLFVYPLILGIMVGRVGCFLTGVSDHTAGLPCSLAWCFDQGDGIARHPTALYEIVFLGLFWIVLAKMEKRIFLENGALFRLFVIGYSLFRLSVDFIKPRETLFLGLSSIQIGALFIAIFYLAELMWRYHHRPFPGKPI